MTEATDSAPAKSKASAESQGKTRVSRPPQRHHILPQFYLRGFTAGGADTLRCYDKDTCKVISTSIRNAAVRKSYNSYPAEDGTLDKQSFETFFSRIEDGAAAAIRALIEHKVVSDQSKIVLSEFVALMHTRVPAFRENQQRVMGRLADMMLVGLTHDESKCRALIDEVQAQKPTNVPVTPEIMREALLAGRVQMSFTLPSTLPLVVEFADRMTLELRQMEWVIVEASPGAEYVTSDNPVCREAPARDERNEWNPVLGLPSVEVTFPLSRELALLASWQRPTCHYVVARPAVVREVNRRTVMSAQRFVYSPRESAGLLRLVKKHAKRRPVMRLETEWEAGGATLKITTQPLAVNSLVSMLSK
jgi:hypothetical protein